MLQETVLVHTCAPTLAGLKTASLINIPFSDKKEINREISGLNRKYCKKGLRIIPLCYKIDHVLLYIYRPAMLRRDMENPCAKCLLQEMGYCFTHADTGVAQLAKRMRTEKDFPHEVGLFLGYPPEDVMGFIRHKETGCKHVGDWRVYGDAEAAKKTFARYQKCRTVYRNLFSAGKSMEALTVKTAV